MTAIECDPYDPYACPVAAIEDWHFENGLLKSVVRYPGVFHFPVSSALRPTSRDPTSTGRSIGRCPRSSRTGAMLRSPAGKPDVGNRILMTALLRRFVNSGFMWIQICLGLTQWRSRAVLPYQEAIIWTFYLKK